MEDIDCPHVDAHVHGSDTEKEDDHIVVRFQREDAQSVEKSPSELSKEEDGPDLRLRAVQALQISEGMESMDQVVLVGILKI